MPFLLLLARLLIRIMSWLPQEGVNLLARLLAALSYRLPWHKNLVIKNNLAMCFPDLGEKQRRDIHRRYLFELFRLVFEARVVWHWSKARIRRAVEVVPGPELLTPLPCPESQKRPGTLYVSGHFGNWELLNLRLGMDQPITTLYRAPENQRLDQFINQPRSRFGAKMVPGDRAALKHLLSALRSGQAASIAADIQPKRGEGLFVPFFGIEALTMTLVHKLARRTGCRVVLTVLTRKTRGDNFTLVLSDATEMLQTDDALLALSRVNGWLEQQIKSAPEQYLWLYKRFSKRPEGEPPRYPQLKKPA